MVERGEASAEDIDTAMKLGAGYREFTKRLLCWLTYDRKPVTDCRILVDWLIHSYGCKLGCSYI